MPSLCISATRTSMWKVCEPSCRSTVILPQKGDVSPVTVRSLVFTGCIGGHTFGGNFCKNFLLMIVTADPLSTNKLS